MGTCQTLAAFLQSSGMVKLVFPHRKVNHPLYLHPWLLKDFLPYPKSIKVPSVGCIYAPYKVNPNIFQFYFDFLDIFHHTSMHPLFRNIYEFYLIFYDFISSSIIYNNYLWSRRHFLF